MEGARLCQRDYLCYIGEDADSGDACTSKLADHQECAWEQLPQIENKVVLRLLSAPLENDFPEPCVRETCRRTLDRIMY